MKFMIERAADIAIDAHAQQKRKHSGVPYVIHPFAVAGIVDVLMQGSPKHVHMEAITVALLHDVVEDTPWELDDLREADGDGFPETVVSGVDSVSRREGESYWDFIDRAAEHPIGRIVKIADIQHNMSTLPEGDSLLKRYRKALAILEG